MKIALVQIQTGDDKAANLKKAEAYLCEAAKHQAELIVFPESLMYRAAALGVDNYGDIVESIDGPFARFSQKIRRVCCDWVVYGKISISA